MGRLMLSLAGSVRNDERSGGDEDYWSEGFWVFLTNSEVVWDTFLPRLNIPRDQEGYAVWCRCIPDGSLSLWL